MVQKVIGKAYQVLGRKSAFYDGMITCTSFLGKAVNAFVWGMNKSANECYFKKALSGIPADFSGRLLEVPVGTGVITMPVYRKLEKADITCFDYSNEMMSVAQKRAALLDLPQVGFVQGDVGNLPFKDGTFDIVVSLNGFHAFPDKDAAFHETFRVLKPGGVFCGCFYVQGQKLRTDWIIRHLYVPRGFFTPPFNTVESLSIRLKSLYDAVSLDTVKSIACFCCHKSGT